jgi:hypothetical protein
MPVAWLANYSFEAGPETWRPVNVGNAVTMNVVRDGTARSGSAFLRASSTQGAGSVAADFRLAGSRLASIGAIAWVRAKPGSPNVSGQLSIWQLSATRSPKSSDLVFTVGNEWKLLANSYDLVQDTGRFDFRVEFYFSSVNVDLDVDCVMVV